MTLNSTEIKWLTQHCGSYTRFEEPMALHTTFRAGGPAEVYIEPPDHACLMTIINWLLQNNIPYRVIGAGSNLLVKDNGIHGVVISLKKCYQCRIEVLKKLKYTILNVAAGVQLQTLCQFAIKHGLKGLNFALGIPGTVGGSIMMNAGANGRSMGDVLESVTVFHAAYEAGDHQNGKSGTLTTQKKKIPKSQLKIKYRQLASFGTLENLSNQQHSMFDVRCSTRPIILECCMRLHYDNPSRLKKEAMAILKKRRLKQPIKSLSAGCFFKNPTGTDKHKAGPAGKLIEQAGLKGKRIGGARISTKHANFIINTQSASASDILALKDSIQESVFKRFGITLDPEVEIIG